MFSARFRAAGGAAAILSLSLAAACAQSQAASTPHARMAPLAQYLSPSRQAEVALARSAAPPSISRHATVMVFTPHGYEVAEKGDNGFTCLVERSWMEPFDDTEFWDSKMRGPVCYNAEASRSVLAYTLKRTDMVLAGQSEQAIYAGIKAAVAANQLPHAQPGSMAYMMSKGQYLTESAKSWMPHVMFYSAKADTANDGASWGADLDGSPVLFDNAHHVNPEPWSLFFVPVSHWSDGSHAPQM